MMKKLTAILTGLILAINFLTAQVKMFKTYDTIQLQHIITGDGLYLAGYYYSYPDMEIILQKTDPSGNTEWIKQYDYKDYLYCYDIIRNTDGDLVILGAEKFREAGNPSDTASNIFLIKTDPEGDTIWTSRIDIKKFDYATAIVETSDHGYLITGSVRDISYTSENILIAKIGSDGELQWWRTFGGTEPDYGNDIVCFKDSTVYVSGQYTNDIEGLKYPFLMKTSIDGDSIWLKTYDFYENAFGNDIILTNDTGLLFIANSPSYPVYPRLIKTDLAGDTTWTRMYDLGNGDESFNSILQSSDNGYLLGGYVDGHTDVRPPWSQMALFKLDPDGEIVWYKKYLEESWTKKIFKSANDLVEYDNGYLILGTNSTMKKTHLFKIDHNGCYLQTPLIEGTGFFCSTDSTVLFTNSVYSSLTWSTGSHDEEIYVDSSGNYHLTVVDTNNCLIRSDTIEIHEHVPPEFIIETDKPTTICSGDSVTLTINITNYDPVLNYTYTWGNGYSTVHKAVAYSPGMYSIHVDDEYCHRSDSLEVSVHYPFQEKICIVTVDRSTGKNLVVWERTPDMGIAEYRIYREDQYIGSVPYADLSIFLDVTADPEKRAYIYQISVLDTCGNESDPSPYHKPHFLQFVSADGGVNLEWDDYLIEGDSANFVNYTIYRGSDSVALNPLEANIPRLIHNYTDNDPSTRTTKYFYRIAGNLLNACYPSSDKKADPGPYSHSMSNIEENRLQNHSPTNILLDNHSLDENQPANIFVGRFSAVDQDSADTHVFILISGEGDTDNSSFSVSGDSLICKVSPDYESINNYSIRVQCKENGVDSLTFEKIFTIIVNDIKETGFADVYAKNLEIFPNPSRNTSMIAFTNPDKTRYVLYLFNVSGKMVYYLNDIYDDQALIPRNNLPPGIYFVELRGDRIYRGKLIIE